MEAMTAPQLAQRATGGTNPAAQDEIAAAQSLPWVCRDAIAPKIWRDGTSGAPGAPAGLWVESNGSPGCYGGWELIFPVRSQPGDAFVFEIDVKGEALARGRDALVAEAFWHDDAGALADWDPLLLDGAAPSVGGRGELLVQARFAKRLRSPAGATQLRVRCGLRWTAHGRAHWSGWRLRSAPAREPRTLRLGVASRPPEGPRSLESNVAHFVAQCRLAGEAGIDLVTLPETILSYGVGRSAGAIHAAAVPLPGPWLEPFQDVARAYRLGICFSVPERAGVTG